jgi:hypothetical protein
MSEGGKPRSATAGAGGNATEQLAAKVQALTRKFDNLATDTHLPFLELRLYRKYYIQTQSEQRLKDLQVVLDAMARHRRQTLAVLKAVHEREGIMKEIKTKADEFGARKTATLDVQTQVLQLLHAHQQASLRVIEGVLEWRSGLTRPYPFHWNNGNYLQKMLDDCAYLDACNLRTVLPMRLTLYPLCSNISSLSLFAPGAAASAARDGNPKAAAAQMSTTYDDRKKAEAMQARLREAEKALFDEEGLQVKVMRDLTAVSRAGYFVPLLNLQSIIPSCATGIRLSNEAWMKQLSEAITDVAGGPPDIEGEENGPHRAPAGGTPLGTPAASSSRSGSSVSSSSSSTPSKTESAASTPAKETAETEAIDVANAAANHEEEEGRAADSPLASPEHSPQKDTTQDDRQDFESDSDRDA